MAFFTIIVEFSGGTYIAQKKAVSPQDAYRKWTRGKLARPLVSFRKEIEGAELVRISRTKSVWCTSAVVKKRLLLVNVIKTNPR